MDSLHTDSLHTDPRHRYVLAEQLYAVFIYLEHHYIKPYKPTVVSWAAKQSPMLIAEEDATLPNILNSINYIEIECLGMIGVPSVFVQEVGRMVRTIFKGIVVPDDAQTYKTFVRKMLYEFYKSVYKHCERFCQQSYRVVQHEFKVDPLVMAGVVLTLPSSPRTTKRKRSNNSL
jgi:hypothetical protein